MLTTSTSVPDAPVVIPDPSTVFAEPVTVGVIFVGVLWLAVTKGIPAIWESLSQDNRREEQRFDELLSWFKQWVVTTETNTRAMTELLAQQQNSLARIEDKLTSLNSRT